MASVLNIGTAGAPLSTPPITEWQAAVRDALNSSDITVNARIAAAQTVYTGAGSFQAGWSGVCTLKRQGNIVVCLLSSVQKSTAPANNEKIVTIPPGFQCPGFYGMIRAGNAAAGSGLIDLIVGPLSIDTFNPAPAQALRMYAIATWYTPDSPPAS